MAYQAFARFTITCAFATEPPELGPALRRALWLKSGGSCRQISRNAISVFGGLYAAPDLINTVDHNCHPNATVRRRGGLRKHNESIPIRVKIHRIR